MKKQILLPFRAHSQPKGQQVFFFSKLMGLYKFSSFHPFASIFFSVKMTTSNDAEIINIRLFLSSDDHPETSADRVAREEAELKRGVRELKFRKRRLSQSEESDEYLQRPSSKKKKRNTANCNNFVYLFMSFLRFF